MYARRISGSGFGLPRLQARPPADLLALLSVLFVTFALQFFASTAAVPQALRLAPAVWNEWQLWRLASYPFVGFGAADLWFVVELLVLFFFAREVRAQLGLRRFWALCSGVGIVAGLLASSGAAIWPRLVGDFGMPLQLMQGQRVLLATLLAAFAGRAGDFIIYVFFVLPLPARYLPLVGIALASVAYFATGDLFGWLGVVVATATAWLWVRPGFFRRWRLHVEQRIARLKLRRLERRRGWRVLEGGRGGPTIH